MIAPCIYCSFYYNFLPVDKDKLAEKTFTEDSNLPIPISTMSCAFTLISALTSAFSLFSTKKLFKQFMQIWIKKVKNQTPLLASPKARKEALNMLVKAKNLKLYYGNLQMECYYFCQ